MKFKNKEISRTRVKNNILKVWNICDDSDKFDWYKDANAYARDLSDLFEDAQPNDVSRIVGYLAALSPLKSWDQNKKLAREFHLRGTAGHMSANVDKCKRIEESDGSDDAVLSILNGNRTCAFYLNIKYYDRAQSVTIDRHALSVALGYQTTEAEQIGITKNQYEFFVQCYIWTAMKLGVSPLLLQSSIWSRYRKLSKEEKIF